jgi:hypothetical protein
LDSGGGQQELLLAVISLLGSSTRQNGGHIYQNIKVKRAFSWLEEAI